MCFCFDRLFKPQIYRKDWEKMIMRIYCMRSCGCLQNLCKLVRRLTIYKQVLWRSVVHISTPWTPWTLKLGYLLFDSFFRIWQFGVKCDMVAQSWEVEMTKIFSINLSLPCLQNLYYYLMCSMDNWKIGTLHRVSLLAMKVVKEQNVAFW